MRSNLASVRGSIQNYTSSDFELVETVAQYVQCSAIQGLQNRCDLLAIEFFYSIYYLYIDFVVHVPVLKGHRAWAKIEDP